CFQSCPVQSSWHRFWHLNVWRDFGQRSEPGKSTAAYPTCSKVRVLTIVAKSQVKSPIGRHVLATGEYDARTTMESGCDCRAWFGSGTAWRFGSGSDHKSTYRFKARVRQGAAA